MRNRLEQSFVNPEMEGEIQKDSESSVEEEPVLEIREQIAERFSRLEELAGQIYVESGGTISIAGVAIDQEHITPEIDQKIR